MKTTGVGFLFLWAVLFACNSPSRAQDVLTLGVHPLHSVSIIQEKFSPLAEYLSRELGQKVQLRIGTSYQEHIDAVGRDQLDIAYMGPVGYVQMRALYGPKKLIAVQEVDGKPTSMGIIFTRRECPCESLDELKTGEFAFVDSHSTMGFMLPAYVLLRENPEIITAQRYRFLKTHEDVALGVLAGDFIAGSVKEDVFHTYREKGLKKLAETPPVAEHLFVASSHLSARISAEIQAAFLKLNDSERGLEIMRAIKPTISGFAAVDDSAYDSLRTILENLKQQGLME